MKKQIYISAILLLALWALIKWLKFHWGFYFSDLYVHDQLSRLWVLGEPMWHDHRFGNHLALHNFWLSPLFSIFTIPFGVPGLFLANILLIAAGILYFINHEKTDLFSVILLFGCFLGPYAYWIFDNRPYGWHPELLYLPLGWIFATGLKNQKTVGIIISGLLMILLREDGILVLWTIATYDLTVNRKIPLWSRKNIYLSLICLLIFLAGIGILSMSGQGNSRISEALKHLFDTPNEAILNLITGYGRFLLFSLPFLLLYIWIGAGRRFIYALLLSLPLMLTAWISGLHYFPDTYHGMNWQPRISALWSVLIAGLVFEKTPDALPGHPYFKKMAIPVLWIIQFGLLIWVRDHNLYTMTTDILREKRVYQSDPYYPAYKNLAAHLNRRHSVTVAYEYFHLFHRNVLIWPDYMDKRLENPDYVISRPNDEWSQRYSSGYDSLNIQNGLILKWKKEFQKPDISQIKE